jgi:hypothetical protein
MLAASLKVMTVAVTDTAAILPLSAIGDQLSGRTSGKLTAES